MNQPSNPLPLPLSTKAARTGEQPISFLIAAAMANPKLINLAAGLVDPLTLPIDAMRTLTQRVLSDDTRARAALQYDTTLGLQPLRQACLEHLESLENKPRAEFGLTDRDIVITTGSQQALYLIGDALIDPGDIVIAANPCYFVFTGTLKSLGATVLGVPMTDTGIDVDAVEQLLKKLDAQGSLDRVKLIYTTSYFQNPTGLTLDAEGRIRLLQLAKQFSRRQRILILEDAAYRELRYDGPNLPSMKSLDRDNQFTILTQTFSKPFAPGLKTGYTAMPSDLLSAVVDQKGNHDFGSPSLTQHLVLEAMQSGLYHQQVLHLCDSYRRKRDRMLNALKRFMPQDAGISWTRPGGGLYVWLTVPEYINTSREAALFKDALRRGVMYVPGEYGFQPDEIGQVPRNHLRLSFGQVAPDQIEPGIERLADAVRALLRQAAEPAQPAHVRA